MLNNPIRLFLKTIDYYGVDFKYNSQVGRFYRSVNVPKELYSGNLRFLEALNIKKNEDFYFSATTKMKQFYASLFFVYGIKTSLYLSDYKSGAI